MSSKFNKMKVNTISAIVCQIITVVYGMILPAFYLRYYGSEVNGMVASITQFLGLITFCEAGIGAIIQTALYKPLSQKNEKKISEIMVAAQHFFRSLAMLLIGYVVVLIIFYPNIIQSDYDWGSTVILILAIASGTFSQYYFGMSNQMLINADQKLYIQYLFQIMTLIVTAFLSVIIMYFGGSIQSVKIVSAFILLLRPLLLSRYVKKHYNIDYKVEYKKNALPQKWNGLVHHIAFVIVEHTDTIVLTFFSTMKNVSIYSIYYMIVSGLRQLIESISASYQSLMGNLWYSQDKEKFKNTFSYIEWLIHTLSTGFFSICIMLIIPFVNLYTHNIKDANYVIPLFGALMVLAQFSYCIRLPYHYVVRVVGHYKETQMGAICEAIINVVISVILVMRYGLVGVAIGTICAMLFRTIYLVVYLKKHILYRSQFLFWKQLIIDLSIITISIIISSNFINVIKSWFLWILFAILATFIVCGIILIFNIIFYKQNIKRILKRYY